MFLSRFIFLTSSPSNWLIIIGEVGSRFVVAGLGRETQIVLLPIWIGIGFGTQGSCMKFHMQSCSKFVAKSLIDLSCVPHVEEDFLTIQSNSLFSGGKRPCDDYIVLRSPTILTSLALGERLEIGVTEFEANATLGRCDHFATIDGDIIYLVVSVRDFMRLDGLFRRSIHWMAHG
ncbi:hypothetical protein ACHAXS_011720 [Conticribra weissflogii]